MKICIVGAGKLGISLATALFDSGNEICLVEEDQQRASVIGNTLDILVYQLDALIVENLKTIDIGSYDLLIACTESDEKNMTLCSFAKKLGCNQTIARVRSPEHAYQMEFIKETFGIDYIVNPNFVCAKAIYKYLTHSQAFEGGLFTKDGISILEFKADKIPGLVDKQVKDTGSLLNGILISAIDRDGKIIVPHGDTLIQKDDLIYTAGQSSQILEFSRRVAGKEKNQKIKNVMIAGGGRTGYFLARMLGSEGIGVKIIEVNKKRCEELASELDNVMIINANANDLGVLKDENIDSTDAFVAATGASEENLLASMLVKSFGVDEVVAVVSRGTYNPIIDKLGTSAIINPQEIITSDVLTFARKEGVVVFSKIINGQAEFREIQVESSMPITKAKLSELDIPNDILVLAVHRGKNIIIPNGSTQIGAGDRVLFISLLSASGELESLISSSVKSVL